MKKLPSTLPNMILSLGIICLIIAGILALVNVATKDTIAQAETKAKVEAIKEIVPAFDNNPYEERDTVTLEGEDPHHRLSRHAGWSARRLRH